jgi:putative Holliday junction resolvase
MRYLAIDYGAKRTGLAICDAAETIASPLNVIQGQKELLTKIAVVVQKEGVEAIVVGLPLNMNDSESAQTELVRKFADRLRRYLTIPVHLQDERLTSFGAEQKLASADLRKAEIQKHSDAVAAAEILEAFLEQKHNTGENGTDSAH